MAERRAYIVVQEGPNGPHVQVRGSNGRIVFSSELYSKQKHVARAIEILLTLDGTTPVLYKNRDNRTTKEMTITEHQ